jgi:hypothetical protein
LLITGQQNKCERGNQSCVEKGLMSVRHAQNWQLAIRISKSSHAILRSFVFAQIICVWESSSLTTKGQRAQVNRTTLNNPVLATSAIVDQATA